MIKGALLTTANLLSKPLYQGNLINNRSKLLSFWVEVVMEIVILFRTGKKKVRLF